MRLWVLATVLSGLYVAICSLMPGGSISTLQFWTGYAFSLIVAFLCRKKASKPADKAISLRKIIPVAGLALAGYGYYLCSRAPENVETGAFEAVTETSYMALSFACISTVMCLIFIIILKVTHNRRER
jgi:hypothetical protein